MGYLLDTNIVSASLKQNIEVALKMTEIRRQGEFIGISGITIFQKASEIHSDLTNRGKIIQDADILIAATAIIHNLILVSHDSDLTRVKDLQLEN